MMASLAREVHALPGRTRLRIDEKRGDEAYFTDRGERTERLSGRFGGRNKQPDGQRVGISHSKRPYPFGSALKSRDCFISAANDIGNAQRLHFQVSATTTPARKARRPKSEAARTNRANWRPLIFLAWVGVGIAQAIEGNIAIPAAAAFWYAYLVTQENGVSNTELG